MGFKIKNYVSFQWTLLIMFCLSGIYAFDFETTLLMELVENANILFTMKWDKLKYIYKSISYQRVVNIN
jgi:hypothetical protein